MTKGERTQMASKGYGNLWIMAIGLIGIFVLATVVAPEFISHGNAGGKDGWNSDMPSGEAIFHAPTTTLSGFGLKANQAVPFTVYSTSIEKTTGKGGIFAWIFRLEGAGGAKDVAELKYGDGSSSVAWYTGSGGAIVGVGPRFVQGPGAVFLDQSASMSLTFKEGGKYTLGIWMASSSRVSDIDPSNYTSVSPMAKISLNVEKPVQTSVSVTQSMSVPSNITEGQWSDFSITNMATGTGGWSEPIGLYLAIERKGIKVSDVTIRVSAGSGYSFPSFSRKGDKLVALINTRTPLTGSADPESVSWTTSFQLMFGSSGNYTLTSWAEDRRSGDELTVVTYDILEVRSTVVAPPDPEPEPEPPPVPEPLENSTGNSSAVGPILPPAVNNGRRTNA
jgi:hypothetical protein